MGKREIHCCHMGHGLVFYDVNNEINNDYEKVAFADSNRVVQLYANNLNDTEKNLIFDRVKNSDGGVSVCQPECKILIYLLTKIMSISRKKNIIILI